MKPARIRTMALGKGCKGSVQEGGAPYRKRLPGLVITEFQDSTMAKEPATILAALLGDERLVVLIESLS